MCLDPKQNLFDQGQVTGVELSSWWLLQGCLTMDPAQRLSCTVLLQHPYMDQNKEIYDSPNRKDKPERNKNKPASRASNHYVSLPVIKN